MSGLDSLTINNSIELLNGGVRSTNPLCLGAMFRLQPGADPGDPQPTQDYVASLLIDGERPFGQRTSNRQITLPIWITGPTRGIVAAAREVLQMTVNQDFWPLTWTRDAATNATGLALPMILDCFRALPSKAVFNTLQEKQGYGVQILLTIPALPFGRSATQIQVPFTSPAPAPSAPLPPPNPVTIDNFSSISSTQCTQSPQSIVGLFSAQFDPDSPLVGDPGGQQTPFVYSNTYSTPLNLAGQQSLQLYLGLGSRYPSSLEYKGATSVHAYVTLTDNNQQTFSFSRSNMKLPVSPVYASPVFSRISIPIPVSPPPGFNISAVTKYQLTFINRLFPVPRLGWCVAYLNNLTAQPASQTVTPVVHGSVYTLYGVIGSARTQAAFQFQQPPTAGTPTVITATGPGTYTVPANTAYLKVECIGGGGPGATMTAAGQGGGGGGAEYSAELVFACLPGQIIPYTVGAGGAPGSNGQPTVFGPAPGGSVVVTANGGLAAATNNAVGGLGGSGSTNAIEHPGGVGRTASGGFGGGGGGSGGSTLPGNSPVGSTLQLFTAVGTTMWVCPAGVTQVTAEPIAAGGGGGAGAGFGSQGAGGGGGQCAIGQVPVTPGNSYPVVVGGGGTAGTAGGNGGPGGLSSFTGDGGAQILAEPGGGGQGSAGFGGGQGAGGTGGTGTTLFNGGQGGSGWPYAGGGGSSASPAGAGNAGGSPAGATAPTGGGNGGNSSGSGAVPGNAGVAPGGGGGGSYRSGQAAGAGANGQVTLVFSAAGIPTNVGATAVPGGGAGGAGGVSTGNPGANGSQPGGGGGGGNSSGATEVGGTGGNGQITITPFQSAAFKTLIVHRPPLGTPKTWQPIVSVGQGLDAPGISYPLTPPSLVPAQVWDFEDGTVDGWTGQVATVANSTAWAWTGTHSLLITSTGGANFGATSPSGTSGVPVTPGQLITVSLYLKNPNVSTTLNSVILGISWYTSTGSLISTTFLPNTRAVAAGAVTGFSITNAPAPVGAAFCAVVVQDQETTSAGVAMAIDAVQVIPSTVATFNGTYTIYLANQSWNGTGSRTISVSVTQVEYTGGPSYSVSTVPITITPSQVNNGILCAGILTLPIKPIPADNTQVQFYVAVNDSNSSDRWNDAIVLDTMGQTFVINEPTTGYVTYYADLPNPNVDLGNYLLGSANGRPAAIGVMDNAIITGPLFLEPSDGDNLLMAYSADALAPNIGCSYYPAWWYDRFQ